MLFKKHLYIAFATIFLFQSLATAQKHQRIEKSIAIEYAYDSIAATDMMGQLMFSKKRLLVYADADFFVIRSYSANPSPKTMDAIVLMVVQDLKTGKAYSCMTIGDKKLREVEPEKSQIIESLFGDVADSSYTLTQTSAATTPIKGFYCEKWHLAQADMVSPFLYLTKDLEAIEAIEKMPMFVRRDGKLLGLCLGNDTDFGASIYRLRAQNVEIDKPQPIAEQLATFKDSNKEDMNKAIKKLLGF